MGLTLYLPGNLPCPTCGRTAHLVEGLLTRDIGDGINVTVDSVPVYRCESCLGETMELLSSAQIEEYLDRYIADVQPRHHVQINIKWDKSRRNNQDETVLFSDRPELVMTM